MPILFSAIAYEKKISAEYASCDGNFTEIVDEVLKKIPFQNEKMTYSHGHYLLHYVADNACFYFCITDKTCQRSRAFLYLNELKRRFKPRRGTDKDLCAVLADEMYRYNEDYSTIVIRKGELEELNAIGVGDSETILGEKILFINNPEELRYAVAVTQMGEIPRRTFLETPRENIEDNFSNAKEKSAEFEENLENDYIDVNSKGNYKTIETKFLYYVMVTVILVLIWLILSSQGPLALVLVACICIITITKFPKGKKEC